ncbi:uncharacterized protein LOC121427397 isoform X1 [Lytechinus variegatus]|uniref:uncharacterized protein LOC121427397 isoform X1 n=1 Tax=Lytechinus variegatus TaxID=7654 RepID=UPI001BB1F901|nr:uncharacterized protein LOC121427397 isoform X1 [Lytechinus variegatus]
MVLGLGYEFPVWIACVIGVLGIGLIIVTAVWTINGKKSSCFRCPCSSADDETSVHGKAPSELLPTVQLRKDAGRGGGRSNTWPWQNQRPPCSKESIHGTLEVRGHGGSSVIFSSNSLCLKVVKDDDEDSEHDPQFKGSVEVYDGDGENKEEGKLDDIQSIVSDFEEEVLKALNSSAEGMSDSLKNVAGSFSSMSVIPGAGYESHCKVKWVVGDEKEESDCGDAVEMTDDESDVALLISDDSSDGSSHKDIGSLPDISVTEADNEMEGFVSLNSPALLHPRTSSLMKYHYSMRKEEILCCSSNTSSLALEYPRLNSFSGDDLDLNIFQGFPNSIEAQADQRLSELRPFMLYRYSISLEEVQYPTHSLSRNVPAALLPMPLTMADDEDSEVFYDALSTIGSTRSSYMDPQIEAPNRNSLAIQKLGRRSTYFSTSSDKTTLAVRRCSSLHDLI